MNLDLIKVNETDDASLKSIDCSDRNLLDLDRDLVIDIFKKFTNLKILNLGGNNVDSLVSFNTLLQLLINSKKLKSLFVNEEVEEKLYELGL